MPISQDTIIEANRKMLGKTNRAVLFAKVNTDEILDPDVPEEDQERTPSLEWLLANIDNLSAEAFISEVNERMTVTSFKEFLDKFQPGFYYRVRPPQAAPSAEDFADAIDTEGGEGSEGGGASAGAADDGAPLDEAPPSAPQLEFSLEGGPGWKKVRITTDHPYIRCLSDLIKKRVRQDISTFRVDVDASLFAFKPKNQRALMRKSMEDVESKYNRLMLEAGRNKTSNDTRKALAAYKESSAEMQTALEDSVRALPTVVYGLEQTIKELKRSGGGGGGIDPNVYEIEFGSNRRMIASPRTALKQAADAVREARALAAAGGGGGPAAIAAGGGSGQPAALGAGEAAPAAEGGTGGGLAKTEEGAAAGGGLAKTEAGTALAKRTLTGALDKLRDESVKYTQMQLAEVQQEKRFPIVVGKFMDGMIQQGAIAPLMGNMLAVVLQNPKELALLNPDIKDVEVFHDMFLGVYSNAVEDFLRVVTPLFETIMGVYLLFNEFPADVRLSESQKPQLILANANLPDLMLTRKDELKRFFEHCNAQATNQFRDAISFVIVPNVAPFKKKRPQKKSNKPVIDVGDGLLGDLEFGFEEAAGEEVSGYGAVTYLDEIDSLTEWGQEYFFQTLFSGEERIKAGRVNADFFNDLAESYAVENVVEKEGGDTLIMCVPDFIIMPPDGKLVTGKTADGKVEVGVDVPELTVRSCYIAAGRIMANDVPDYLVRKMQKNKQDPTRVRKDIPGIGVDLSVNTFLGESEMPTDHFLGDGILSNLLSSTMPFTVFTHVAGRSPFLSVPRTMRKLQDAQGNSRYRLLHLFRQQAYLNRLLRAAHELGFGGAFPEDKAEAEAFIASHIDYILQWTNWYDPTRLVNSFPSKLNEVEKYTVIREEGNAFRIAFGFEQGLLDPLQVRF